MSQPEFETRVDTFVRDATTAFPRLDTHPDGVLEKGELAAAITNPSVTGVDAEAAAVLYMQAEQIGKLSAGTPGGSKPAAGLSLDEISGLANGVRNRLKSCAGNPEELSTTWLNPIFWSVKTISGLDKSGDGFLTRGEIGGGSPVEQFLRKHYAAIVAGGDHAHSGRGIDGKALSQFMQSIEESCGPAWDLKGMLRRADAAKAAGVSKDLFADARHPENSVKVDAIRQGVTGNCYFLASLTSVAAADRAAIVRMIKDNKDGTLTVTFPGAPESPVTVRRSTDAELILFNGASQYGIWANVLEKAFAQYQKNNQPDKSESGLVQEALKGATPVEAMRLLTGKQPAEVDLASTPQDELQRQLLAARQAGKTLVTGIDMFQMFMSQNYDYPAGHAYAILDFDAGGADGGTLTMRNPWGREAGPRGTFQVSLKEFRRIFSRVYAA